MVPTKVSHQVGAGCRVHLLPVDPCAPCTAVILILVVSVPVVGSVTPSAISQPGEVQQRGVRRPSSPVTSGITRAGIINASSGIYRLPKTDMISEGPPELLLSMQLNGVRQFSTDRIQLFMFGSSVTSILVMDIVGLIPSDGAAATSATTGSRRPRQLRQQAPRQARLQLAP